MWIEDDSWDVIMSVGLIGLLVVVVRVFEM